MATTHDIDEPLPREATILTITGPRELGFITRPLPDVGPDQALVRTCFSGVSHGTEMNVYRGYAPQWRKHYDRDTRLFRPTTEEELAHVPERGYWTAADRSWNYPLAYGYANVGRVLATGDAVDTVKPGDLVYAYQPHQTAYVAPAASLIPLPTLSTPAVGVLYSNLNTAYGGVLDADIRIDDTVVIFGQGLIGLLVAQFVRGTAARQVITVEGLPQRRAMSLSRGVDACLDPATDDVALAVRERTGGRGADVVIDASGSYAALQEAIRTAAPNTTVIALSWYGGTGGALALSDEFHHNRITIRCSQVGGIAPELSATHSLARRSAHILDWFGELDLESLVTDTIPFRDAARAYDLIDRHSDQVIQVALAYDVDPAADPA